MSTHRTSKKARTGTKPARDPKLLLSELRDRLVKERAGLDRRQARLLRAFHTYERQFRQVGRLARRVSKLESA